jgi:hypothetical protein
MIIRAYRIGRGIQELWFFFGDHLFGSVDGFYNDEQNHGDDDEIEGGSD